MYFLHLSEADFGKTPRLEAKIGMVVGWVGVKLKLNLTQPS